MSFGHPPKGQPAGEPFGSVSWTNAMRMTWSGLAAEGDGHHVRWRPRKRNERGRLSGVLLTFEYDQAGRLCAASREDDEEVTRDWILRGLVDGPRTVYDLVDELLDEEEEAPTNDSRERARGRIAHALRRMQRDGWIGKAGKDGRADRWVLMAR